jgi:hypothetical protein
MVYVVGSRLYGKVDEVKGLGHVATKFGHFDYFPLFPMGSWLVISQDGNGWQGVQIPFSFKSMLMGWGRGVALITLVVSIFTTVMAINEWQTTTPRATRAIRNGKVVTVAPPNPLLPVAGSVGMFVASAWVLFGSRWTPGFGKATARRAEALARLAGLPEEAIEQLLREQYGSPPAGGFEVVPGRMGAGAQVPGRL